MSYSVQSKKTGVTYFLHSRETDSRGGKRLLYFFSKEVKDGALDALPSGYVVTESEKTGLPLLKRA
jgi:hypothetical protein